ncbi:MAG: hypothetical protein M9893_04630 [Pyrinomonadaceae bacterium]|nr:hypothetical protein [Pyrinomonadaceae bacterium]
MCGRASQRLSEDFALMIAHFTLPDILTTRNNLRPTEPAWIVARRGDGVIRTLRARWWCQREGGTHFKGQNTRRSNARVRYDARTGSGPTFYMLTNSASSQS